LNCKKPVDKINLSEKKEILTNAIIIYNSGESSVKHYDGTEEKAKVGVSFKSGDKITTGAKSKVDIQLNSNSILRLNSNTTIEFINLVSTLNSIETKINLLAGKIHSSVNKKDKNEIFTIVTETNSFDIKNSILSMEFANEDNLLVKLFDGSISLKPRIPSIEKLSLTKIDSKPEVKKINNLLSEISIQIDKGVEIEIPSSDKLLKVKKIDETNVGSIQERLNQFKKIITTESDYTKNELQEFKTFHLADNKTLTELFKINDELSSGKIEEEKAKDLEKKRKILEDKITNKLDLLKAKFNEELVVKPRKFKTKKEVLNFYDHIERVQMSNNRIEIGSIINQEDSIIILHTENGIINISKDEIIEIIYDYQLKFKF
jgi:hypothetical protein